MISYLIPDFFTFLLFGLVASLAYYYISLKRNNLPPGPLPIPIIGNLYLMFWKSSILDLFDEMRRRYGDIFTFYMGHNPFVVICGYDGFKEAFLNQGDTFTPHPESFLTKELGGGKGLLSSNGPEWKGNRRFTLSTLRDFGLGKNIMQSKIQEELKFMEERLSNVAEAEGTLDLREPLFCTISNTINSIIFGKRFDYDDNDFVTLKTAINDNMKSLSSGGLLLVFEWLRYLPGDMFNAKRAVNNAKRFMSVLDTIADKHEDSFDGSDVKDFFDAYNREIKKREVGEGSIFDRNQLVYTVADLFIAGSETTSTLLYWVFAYLVNYPEIQEDLVKEIREKIGMNRAPTMADKTSMPLVEATINESLRMSDLAGTGFPHCPGTDTKLLGYDIPKGTPIAPFMHCISFDKKLWGDPENFRPSRWLDADGNFSKPEHAIFFFLGKRSCIGESLARMESFLVVTSLLQKFKFSVPDKQEKPSLVGHLGLVNSPQDYEVKLTYRN